MNTLTLILLAVALSTPPAKNSKPKKTKTTPSASAMTKACGREYPTPDPKLTVSYFVSVVPENPGAFTDQEKRIAEELLDACLEMNNGEQWRCLDALRARSTMMQVVDEACVRRADVCCFHQANVKIVSLAHIERGVFFVRSEDISVDPDHPRLIGEGSVILDGTLETNTVKARDQYLCAAFPEKCLSAISMFGLQRGDTCTIDGKSTVVGADPDSPDISYNKVSPGPHVLRCRFIEDPRERGIEIYVGADNRTGLNMRLSRGQMPLVDSNLRETPKPPPAVKAETVAAALPGTIAPSFSVSASSVAASADPPPLPGQSASAPAAVPIEKVASSRSSRFAPGAHNVSGMALALAGPLTTLPVALLVALALGWGWWQVIGDYNEAERRATAAHLADDSGYRQGIKRRFAQNVALMALLGAIGIVSALAATAVLGSVGGGAGYLGASFLKEE